MATTRSCRWEPRGSRSTEVSAEVSAPSRLSRGKTPFLRIRDKFEGSLLLRRSPRSRLFEKARTLRPFHRQNQCGGEHVGIRKKSGHPQPASSAPPPPPTSPHPPPAPASRASSLECAGPHKERSQYFHQPHSIPPRTARCREGTEELWPRTIPRSEEKRESEEGWLPLASLSGLGEGKACL